MEQWMTSLMQSSEVGAMKMYECDSFTMSWSPDVNMISGATLTPIETSFREEYPSYRKALNYCGFSDQSPMNSTGMRSFDYIGHPTVQDVNKDSHIPAVAIPVASSPAELVQMQLTPTTNSFAKRREEQSDVEFLDNLDEPSASETEIETRQNFQSLMEAPILSNAKQQNISTDDVNFENLQQEKENPISSLCSARRNIFAPEVQVLATINASSGSPSRSRRLIPPNRLNVVMPGRGAGVWRKCCSVDGWSPWTASLSGNHSTRLTKSQSEADSTAVARRMDLLQAAAEEGHVTFVGDLSRPCCLPVVVGGKHRDLVAISCETMARVLKNEFDDVIETCTVVDCRYPFEYEGGHIAGALNCYRKEDIVNYFILPLVEHTSPSVDTDRKRRIVVFHCEFSSERGPGLMRFLREMDRDMNSDSYPALHHPEIYLLEGGYRDFQAQYGDLCCPVGGYIPMTDQRFVHQLVRYRQKSKLCMGNSERRRLSVAVAAARGRYCRI